MRLVVESADSAIRIVSPETGDILNVALLPVKTTVVSTLYEAQAGEGLLRHNRKHLGSNVEVCLHGLGLPWRCSFSLRFKWSSIVLCMFMCGDWSSAFVPDSLKLFELWACFGSRSILASNDTCVFWHLYAATSTSATATADEIRNNLLGVHEQPDSPRYLSD